MSKSGRIKEHKPSFSAYRTQDKLMKITRKKLHIKLLDISGTKMQTINRQNQLAA
jgi:hypothetical protein